LSGPGAGHSIIVERHDVAGFEPAIGGEHEKKLSSQGTVSDGPAILIVESIARTAALTAVASLAVKVAMSCHVWHCGTQW